MFSTGLYACEALMQKKNNRDKILAYEMYCYRRLLQIDWTQVTDAELRRAKHKKDLIQVVMRKKMGLFGHVCRMENNRKIKDVMMWMMAGTGRRGRTCTENGWMT